jgi:hypothetical protein
VALVGNTIHWIERVGKCGGREGVVKPPPTAEAPS